MKKKPIREWLETIADPTIREAAISQMREGWRGWPKNGMVRSLSLALWYFNDWTEDVGNRHSDWFRIYNKALNGQLETREVEAPEMKKGYIPYSTEQEREWAIAQAERMGAKLYPENEICRQKDDNCIRIFNDGECMDYDTKKFLRPLSLIPLERPEKTREVEEEEEDEEWGMAQGWIDRCDQVEEKAIKILEKQEQEIKDNANEFTYAWNASKYTKTEQEDGTIILKPKKKKVKVWIEVYISAINGEIYATEHDNKKDLEFSIETGKEDGETLLEVIEREYEI